MSIEGIIAAVICLIVAIAGMVNLIRVSGRNEKMYREQRLEELRSEMHTYIEIYGPTDLRTVEKSQELDEEVNRYYYN